MVLDLHAGLASLAQERVALTREWLRLRRARLDHENNAAARDAEREQLSWQPKSCRGLRLRPANGDDPVGARTLAHAATLMEGVRDDRLAFRV